MDGDLCCQPPGQKRPPTCSSPCTRQTQRISSAALQPVLCPSLESLPLLPAARDGPEPPRGWADTSPGASWPCHVRSAARRRAWDLPWCPETQAHGYLVFDRCMTRSHADQELGGGSSVPSPWVCPWGGQDPAGPQVSMEKSRGLGVGTPICLSQPELGFPGLQLDASLPVGGEPARACPGTRARWGGHMGEAQRATWECHVPHSQS